MQDARRRPAQHRSSAFVVRTSDGASEWRRVLLRAKARARTTSSAGLELEGRWAAGLLGEGYDSSPGIWVEIVASDLLASQELGEASCLSCRLDSIPKLNLQVSVCCYG
jgi:hypothetical protein